MTKKLISWDDAAGSLPDVVQAGMDAITDGKILVEHDLERAHQMNTFALRGVPAYAAPRTGTYDPARCTYNLKNSNMRKWRTALAKGRAGTAPARLNCYGDSITQGATTLPTPIGGNSWPSRLRSKFDAVYGAAGTGATYLLADGDDTRVTWSGTWASYTGFAGFGTFAQQSTTVGSYMTFTATCDQFIIHTFGTLGAGPLACSIDGGAVTNYPSTRTPNGVLAIVVPAGALGSHTLKVQVVTAAVWLESVEATIGTGGVRVTRWGRNNATATWLVNGQSGNAGALDVGSLPFSFDLFPPDLSILAFGVNEFLTHVSVATYKASMQTLITKAKTFGDVLLMTSIPNAGLVGSPSQAELNAALYDLADTNDIALLDLADRWQSFAASSALYQDAVTHPNTPGQWDIAEAVYQAIGTAV